MTAIDHAGQACQCSLFSFGYTFDPEGNVTSATSSAGTESYTYDALGRLTEVTYPNSDVEAFTYDANGNRLTHTVNSVLQHTYTYDAAGQLLADGVDSYSHDAAGNLTVAGSDSFSWDWANRLISATVSSVTESYAYDGDDVRVSSTANSTTTPYLWDRLGGVELLVDDGSQGYVHADGLLTAIDGTDTTYAMPDRLGSVRGLVDETETVVGTADYAAFGVTRSQTGVSLPFGFTGEQTDAATGNIFLRAHYLSPSLGRFLSADSVQPNAPGTQGYNLYGYVANNPATWIDPTGHSAITFAGGGFAALLPFMMAAFACTGLCALALFIILVFLLIAFILDCAVLGCDGFAPQREDLSDWVQDLFSPSTGSSTSQGSPSADPGIPQVELVWPQLPNWQWDTPRSNDPDTGTMQSRYEPGTTTDGNSIPGGVRRLTDREVRERGLHRQKEADGLGPTDSYYVDPYGNLYGGPNTKHLEPYGKLPPNNRAADPIDREIGSPE